MTFCEKCFYYSKEGRCSIGCNLHSDCWYYTNNIDFNKNEYNNMGDDDMKNPSTS